MKQLFIALAAVAFGAGAALAQGTPSYITDAIADSGRPQADRARDAKRRPAETVAFAGLAPGQTVAEILPGDGYYTRILSKVVGPTGKVIALPWSEPQSGGSYQLAANRYYGNISVFGEAILGFRPATPVDMVFTTQNYHDFETPHRAQVNQVLFKALKPGGVYFILDHSGAARSGFRSIPLHRIDKELVKLEAARAGFVFVSESDLLANPADDRTLNVFNPAIRGDTDQFLLKFIKPAAAKAP